MNNCSLYLDKVFSLSGLNKKVGHTYRTKKPTNNKSNLWLFNLLLVLLLINFSVDVTYAQSYKYYQTITVDNTKVSGSADLTNFTVLVKIIDQNLKTTGNGGHVENDNGYDISFSSFDNTITYDHEIEKYDPLTGEYVAWVRIPTLDYNNDTQFRMSYGASGIISNPSKTATWDSNYRAVWHLNETVTDEQTDGIHYDSTPNGNNGSQKKNDDTPGKIANGQNFDGNNDFIDVPSLSATINKTYSFWIYVNSFNQNYHTLIEFGDDGPWFGLAFYLDKWYLLEYDQGCWGKTGLSAGKWYNIAYTSNSSTNRSKVYLNGVEDTDYPTNASTETGAGMGIAYHIGDNSFNGNMDEVRISNIARSSKWIATEYNNQNNPSTFLSFGSESTYIQIPTITSATYDYNSNILVVTGTNFVGIDGTPNDVDVSLLTFTGQGNSSYSLISTTDVEISSATEFSFALSGTDIYNVEKLLNNNGTTSTDATTYNLAVADNWMPGVDETALIADETDNSITVSNYANPEINSIFYDYAANRIDISGTNFVNMTGVANDIDVSSFTITGEDGSTYTLSSSADVEIISSTSFSILLSGIDIYNVEALLNKNGTISATNGVTYNLAAADNWMTGSPTENNITDATNGITVSNYTNPEINSITYDYSTNQLIVLGTNIVNKSGTANDVDVSLFTITGDGASTYTLSSTSDYEITSSTEFSLTLSGNDIYNVEALLNKNGTSSVDLTTYNLAAADNWMTGSPTANNISNVTIGITVINYQNPSITYAFYDVISHNLVVTGTNFVCLNGAQNDVDASLFTIKGQGGSSYTLNSSVDVDVTSDNEFTISLSGTDIAEIELLLNNNGTQSSDNTIYNLSATDNWMAGSPVENNIYDGTNGITVGNISAPTATTSTANSIGLTSATLNGIINANNSATVVTYEYGLTEAYGNTINATPATVSGNINTAVSASISLLAQNTTYHFRVKGVNSSGTTYGADEVFTSLAAPTVTTTAATSIISTAATINGIVNDNRSATVVSFEYGTDSGLAGATTVTATESPIAAESGNTNVTKGLTGLIAATKYYYRVIGVNVNGTSTGTILNFTTTPAPTAITLTATTITSTTATLNGSINDNGNITTVTFEYGTDSELAGATTVTATESPIAAGSGDTPVTKNIAGLTPGELYYYRVLAVNGVGSNSGAILNFTTPAAPVTTTSTATSIASTTATLNGIVNDNGAQTTVTFEYSTDANLVGATTVTAAQSPIAEWSGNTAVSNQVTGLSPGIIYYYRVTGVNNFGTNDGTILNFRTTAAPTAITLEATLVSSTTATLNGSINDNGASTNVTFEYGTNSTLIGAATVTAEQSPVGVWAGNTAVSKNLLGLTPGVLYYYRVIGVNNVNTTYGNILNFKTFDVPTVTTSAASLITDTTASLNGIINANGVSTNVTFEYGLDNSYGNTVNATPNIVAGNTNTSVLYSLTGLNPNTTYHYRVLGVNSVGATIGSDGTFTTTYVEINLKQNATNIPSDSLYDFGSCNKTDSSITKTFTVENTGTSTLLLSDPSPYISISGANQNDFSFTTPANSIPAGGTITFDITFDPTESGIRVANVSIANNDNDENPYVLNIQGLGVGAPLGANDSISLAEDNLYQFKESDFTFSDPDSDLFNGIKIIKETSIGSLTYNNVEVRSNLYCPDIAKLKFKAEENGFGNPYIFFTFKVIDDSGEYSINTYEMTIIVNPVNDPPVLSIANTVESNYTEGSGAQSIVNEITVTDIDDYFIKSATIQITSGFNSSEDVLGFSDTLGITGTYNHETATLLLVGSTSKANYEAAFKTITFENTNALNVDDSLRQISFMVNDGNALSNPLIINLNIIKINAPPVLSINEADDAVFIEDSEAILIDTTITVSDADNSIIDSAFVQITTAFNSSEDILGFSNMLGISNIYNSATGKLLLYGSASLSNYEYALHSVTYKNINTNNPDTTKKCISFFVHDGTDMSNAVSRNVKIVAVNDAPVIKPTNSGTSIYSEGDLAININDSITVSDGDNTNIQNATVQITSGFNSAEDLLSISNVPSLTCSYDSSTGILSITGNAAIVIYNDALRKIKYQNINTQQPDTTLRIISFIVNDGNNSSISHFEQISLVAVNNAPVISFFEADSLIFTEDDNAIKIINTINISDVDDKNIESAAVQIISGLNSSEDVFNFSNIFGITGTFDKDTGILLLSGTSTLENYETALNSITYQNINTGNPDTTMRQISIIINDGDIASNILTRNIEIISVNDSPKLNTFEQSFANLSEGKTSIVLDNSITIVDLDNENIESASAQITSGFNSSEDLLSFTSQSGIEGSYNPGSGVLLMVGAAKKEFYEAALRSVSYININTDSPDTTTRQVSFVINDGLITSNTLIKKVKIHGSNNSPIIKYLETSNMVYYEGSGDVQISGNISISDVDNANLENASINLISGLNSYEDELVFKDTLGITGNYNKNSGLLFLQGTSSVSNYITALRSITYRNINEISPDTTQRVISFTVYDGGSSSNILTRNINIISINKAPVITQISDKSIDGISSLSIPVYASDNDNDSLTYSAVSHDKSVSASILLQNDSVFVLITPLFNQNMSTIIDVIISDGIHTDKSSFTVNVSEYNFAPVFIKLENQIINEGETFSTFNLDTLVQDQNDNDDELLWNFYGNKSVSININKDRIVEITQINNDWNGEDTVTFVVSDSLGLADTMKATFTVIAVNDPPVFIGDGIPHIEIYEDNIATINLNEFVTDPDNDSTEISFSIGIVGNSIPDKPNISPVTFKQSYNTKTSTSSELQIDLDSTTNVATFIPAKNSTGIYSVAFTVWDPSGETNIDIVEVSVLPVNDPPEISNIPDIEFPEDSSYCLELNNYVSDIDNNLQDIKWEVSIANSNFTNIVSLFNKKSKNLSTKKKSNVFHKISINKINLLSKQSKMNKSKSITTNTIDNDSLLINIDNVTNVVTLTAKNNFYGSNISIVFTAFDTELASASDTILVTVDAINDPPSISSIPIITFNEDDTLVLPSDYWYNFVADFETPDDMLIYEISSGNKLSVRVTELGKYIFTADENWFGIDTLALHVSDGAALCEKDFLIKVLPVNDLPIIKEIIDTMTYNGNSITIDMWDYVKDIESASESLTFQFSASNDSLIVNYDDSNGQLCISSIEGFEGSVDLEITIIDDDNGATTIYKSFIILNPYKLNDLIPDKYLLEQNYPNPFNPTTTIRFGLPYNSYVNLTIFNLLGQKITELLNDFRTAGYYEVIWNADQAATGIYIYVVTASAKDNKKKYNSAKKMLLVK